MQLTADDRSAFAPPPQPGLVRAFALAVAAHLLLVAALTTGLHWKRDSTEISAEAELWSALPQQAAPREQPAPPAPPAPPPVVRAPPQPDPQVQRDAQIALEREKDKREQAEREEAQREAAERRRVERERKAEAERKLAAERKREEEADKREQAKVAAEARRKEELAKKKREEQEAQRVAKLREENLKRMQGLAGTGAPSSPGTAAVSSGPSGSWGGRVSGRVRPNIVFPDDVSGNPEAVVEVRVAPDGTIVSRRLVKSSGNRNWDEAVLRALDKTETLPRDVDGRMPSFGTIAFRPKT